MSGRGLLLVCRREVDLVRVTAASCPGPCAGWTTRQHVRRRAAPPPADTAAAFSESGPALRCSARTVSAS